MASRISFKQLGNDDIRPYIGGQVFIKSTEITKWKQDITINTSVVKLKNGNALSKLHEENLKLIQVVDSNDNIVGIAIVKQYNATTSQFTINALEYGTGKGKFSIYKSLKDLNKTIDGSTFLVFSDIVTLGITINDLDENQLVYDKDGTVARISTIDVSTNSFTVVTMTTSGKNFMPIAPDTKELKLKNGGSGYSIGDIIESTTPGVFAEVTDVDANGIILDIQDTTSTAQSTSGTGAIIDYDQVIYGGYGSNWAALSDTAVLVAQALADKFEYETGYDFTIGNAGSGYAINDIIPTDIPNINVRIVSVGTSGEIQGVEYTRNTVNTSGTGASITATADSNIFIIPSRYWNNGTALFSLVNDDGAQVEFYRTGDILEKYNAGANGKIYKFTFNEVNGTIKQEATSISASMKEYKSTKQLSTTLEDITTIRVTDIVPIPSINNVSIEQLVYDAKGTVGKITNVDRTSGDIEVKTLTLSGGDFMPVAPDTKELKISNPGSGYTLGDIIETTTLGTFAEVTGVDSLGAITSVILSTSTTQSVTGTNAIIDYDQVVYGGYGKNWAALVNASVTNAQVVADTDDFEVGYDYTINVAGTGYVVGDIVPTDIANVFAEVTSVGASGEILAVDFTRETTQNTSGTNADITATANSDIFVIPTDIWNKGVAVITLTNDDGASIQYYRTGDVLVKYNAGANGRIYKFEYDETKGIIKQSYSKISGGDNSSILEYTSIPVGDSVEKDTTVINDKIIYRCITTNTNTGVWTTDKSNYEELKTDGAILNQFIPNHYYAENEMIIEDNVIYTRKTAGIAGTTLGNDISNWEPQTRLHTSGNRFVRFTNSLSQFTNSANYYSITGFNYVDGDSSLIQGDRLVAPVSGLYYFDIRTIASTLATSSSTKHRKTWLAYKNGTSEILAASSQVDFDLTNNFTFIRHLDKDDYLTFTFYVEGTIKTVSTIPSEFGLITEDQSDNLVCEAEIKQYTSLAAGESNMALQNISNPSVISPSGMITLPEDGSYFVNIDFMQSVSGGTNGSGFTSVSNLAKTQRYLLSKNEDITNGQIPSLSGIITGVKGEQFQISHSKKSAQSGLTYATDYKRYVRIFKIKSVEHKLEPVDLYNEYINRVPSGMIPMSYDSWVKSIVQRNQYRVEAKSISTSVSVNNWTTIGSQYASGISTMLDNNNFVAPVAGLYYLTVNNCVNTTNIKSVNFTLVLKNLSERISYLETDSSTTNYSGASTIIWLDKDEYLTPQVLTRTADTYPAGVSMEFGLIQGGHPLENYPNTWEPGVEYDFGNGLYGQRFIGNVTTTAAKTAKEVLLDSTLYSNIIASGGIWNRGTGKFSLPIGKITSSIGSIELMSSIYVKNNVSGVSGLYAAFLDNGANTTSYDIWVKYTK